MAFAFVNEAHNVSIGPSPSFPTSAIPSVTISATQGNLLVCWCTTTTGANQMQCSDGVNIWVPICIRESAAYGNMYAWLAIAATTASLTVQIFETASVDSPPPGIVSGTAPAAIGYPVLQVLQFSGEYGNPLESFNLATGSSSAPEGSIVAAGTADLILAFGMIGSQNVATTSGWTNAAGAGQYNSAIYAIETGSGTFTPLFAATGSNTWGVITMAFKAASATTSYTISGALGAAGAGATVLFLSQTTGAIYNCTADGSGNYASPALATDTYTVTPQIVGVTYVAASKAVGSSSVTQNFTGTTVPISLSFTTLISDTFTRANENPLSGGGVWVADGLPIPPYDPPAQIVSNQCVMSDATVYANYAGPWSGDANELWNGTGTVLPANQWIELQIPTLSSNPLHYANVSLYIRCGSGGTGYGLVVRNNGGGTANVILFWFGTASASSTPENTPLYGTFPYGVLTLQNVPFSLGDKFRIAALGTTIYIIHNGTIIGNYTDATLVTGFPTFVLSGTSISDVAVTNFLGGSVGPVSIPILSSATVQSGAILSTAGTGVINANQFAGNAIVALANGGTSANLSATGGTSQVLKQVTAGAAITVAQLAASDLSNGVTGSGAVVLAASPALTSVPTAPTASALTDNTQIATTAYADSAVAVEVSRAETAEGLLAPKASPTFTGTVGAAAITASGLITAASFNASSNTGYSIDGHETIGSDGTSTYISPTLSTGNIWLQTDGGTYQFGFSNAGNLTVPGSICIPDNLSGSTNKLYLGLLANPYHYIYSTGGGGNQTYFAEYYGWNWLSTSTGLIQMQLENGLMVGVPTGGDKGTGTINVAGGYYVNGVALSAAMLSNGVTGSGAVMLAASPTTTGTLTAAAITASGEVIGSYFNASTTNGYKIAGGPAIGSDGSSTYVSPTVAGGGIYLINHGSTEYCLFADSGLFTAPSIATPSIAINGGTAITAQSGTGATVAMTASPTFSGTVGAAAITASGTVTAAGFSTAVGGVGYQVLLSGDASNTGWIGWYNASGTRTAYMGYDPNASNNVGLHFTNAGSLLNITNGGIQCTGINGVSSMASASAGYDALTLAGRQVIEAGTIDTSVYFKAAGVLYLQSNTAISTKSAYLDASGNFTVPGSVESGGISNTGNFSSVGSSAAVGSFEYAGAPYLIVEDTSGTPATAYVQANSTSAIAAFGSIGAFDVIITPNTTEKLRIYAAGGIGITGTCNASGYYVGGVALSAAMLSNGVTGSGAVMLAAGPTVTGLLTAAYLTVPNNVIIEGQLYVGSGGSGSAQIQQLPLTAVNGIYGSVFAIADAGVLWALAIDTSGNLGIAGNIHANSYNAGTLAASTETYFGWPVNSSVGPGLSMWGNTSGNPGMSIFCAPGAAGPVLAVGNSGGLFSWNAGGADQGEGTVNMHGGYYKDGTNIFTSPAITGTLTTTGIVGINGGTSGTSAQPLLVSGNNDNLSIGLTNAAAGSKNWQVMNAGTGSVGFPGSLTFYDATDSAVCTQILENGQIIPGGIQVGAAAGGIIGAGIVNVANSVVVPQPGGAGGKWSMDSTATSFLTITAGSSALIFGNNQFSGALIVNETNVYGLCAMFIIGGGTQALLGESGAIFSSTKGNSGTINVYDDTANSYYPTVQNNTSNTIVLSFMSFRTRTSA